MIVVVSSLRVKPEFEAEIKKFAREAVEATRRESGCISYRFFQDAYDACEFCFVEEWRDPEALKAHRSEAHFLRWREQSAHMVAERIIKRYEAKEING